MRTFYIQTIRAQVEYAAPTLANVSETLVRPLEVIQNNAMRIMLGAPMWVRICVLNIETQLPPLIERIDQRNVTTALKTL